MAGLAIVLDGVLNDVGHRTLRDSLEVGIEGRDNGSSSRASVPWAIRREAGLEIGSRGGILVNEYLQSSDPDIYALGDAIATGEVFLKIIPLLNEKGIYTLKDALVASQRTYYTRLKY